MKYAPRSKLLREQSWSSVVQRRSVLKAVAATIAVPWLFNKRARAASDSRIRMGAIRWDAWYGPDTKPKSSEWYAAHDLDPPQYEYRAPFFAKKVGKSTLLIDGTQSDMDAEIKYAATAGINYWAFGWYPAGRPLHKAWELYQSSVKKYLVNWCVLIGLNSLAEKFPPHTELLKYFQEPEYESVDDRPLMFIMHEKANLAKAAQSVRELQSLCSASGLRRPYIVFQCAEAELGASEAKYIRADAISAYAYAPLFSKGPIPYAKLDASVRQFWAELLKTGLSVVPNGMTGWDLRPRIEHPPPFDPIASTMDHFVSPGTPEEIANHIEALLAFVKNNPRACEARRGIIYSWNEFDEGGSALCPSWNERGPDDHILIAVSKKLRQYSDQ